MDKKRRDFINCELINLAKYKQDFKDAIAFEVKSVDGSGVQYSEYQLDPKYGKGTIHYTEFDEVAVYTCNIELKRDLVFYDEVCCDLVQMSFMIDGEKIISLNGMNDVLNENQECYAVKSSVFKGYTRLTGEKPFREILVFLPFSYLKRRGFEDLSPFKSFTDKHLVQSMSNDILSILMSIQETKLTGMCKRLFVEAKILELLALQITNYKNGNLHKIGSTQDKILKKLYMAKQLMADNLNGNYSIKELSRELALNEYILKKEFKRVFGCSINEFYSTEKMNKAGELLKGTQLPIYEIAEEIGYKNATHFSAAFKRFYGKTPKKYRTAL
ncbi:AraC family transcriptional regulator [Galbibacter sp. EGI 63066]|uniref:helix-turn-helix domain-containing protein n=1 Tax=Galbibacter sp. EGI 63066 TaxID=2993559 RepID=UPI00224996D5|nr:AraC family transcriptional regulator [Galbibacter sp. EGI 63066]MCX2679550.1 AraC family transcriptional regulator [Galbibacter sp. EGI 63066]